MVLDLDQVKDIIKISQKTPEWVDKGRALSAELFALLEGDHFSELLIHIEHVEDEKKKKARRKYSKDIRDLFERLLRLVDNVYTANGGSKRYNLEENQERQLLEGLMNVSGGQTLEQWLQTNWMQYYHTDPNGCCFLEYTEGSNPIPTYKSINSIRNYLPNGQKVEWLLFEPVLLKKEDGSGKKLWRLVDDERDWIIIQDGDTLTLNEDETFEHPFGVVPAVINSDIHKLGKEFRVSPIYKVQELAREFARDKSIKTIYKFLHGFPTFWRYVQQCQTCTGTGKDGNDICTDCNGQGYYMKKDVTDMVTLPIPTNEEPVLAPDIAGYIAPELETWNQYSVELENIERLMHATHWGVYMQENTRERTATEVFVNVQPATHRLEKYSNVAERVESMFTEMYANYILEGKDKNQPVSSINYGDIYILEGPDATLERYNNAKEKGDPVTVLDRLFNEYLMSKYKSDPVGLAVNLVKSEVEPYIHYGVEEVREVFGNREAQRKMRFNDWWNTLDDNVITRRAEQLRSEYDVWFSRENPEVSGEDITDV